MAKQTVQKNLDENNAAISVQRAKGRMKEHQTPEKLRIAATYDKKRLQIIKVVSTLLEIPKEDVLLLAVDIMAHKYQKLTPTDIFEEGKDAFFK